MMRYPKLMRILHEVTNLLLGAACLVMAVTLATSHFSSYAIAGLVVCLATATTVAMQWRGRRIDRRVGQLDEQEYVLISVLEAHARGMTLREWTDGYVEHSVVDRESTHH